MSDHSLVWFRGKDLRITDHVGLQSALRRGRVTLLFVVDPYFFAPKRARELPHRMQYLVDSLGALAQNIEARGGKLFFVEGKSVDVVPQVAERLSVTRVVASRWTEPFGRLRDERIAQRLRVPFDLVEGETLLPPEAVRTASGTPFAVFTPFARAARALLSQSLTPPESAPKVLPDAAESERLLAGISRSCPTLEQLGIERNEQILAGGERAARARLKKFLAHRAGMYQVGRDLLGEEGTSRLSQDLKFGVLSIREVWWQASELRPSAGVQSFLNELLWREFAYATLWDRPRVLEQPFRSAFADFPYDGEEAHYEAWERGVTGVPVVDAAARQLLREGFVHNRARMISASFLSKNLRISYKKGEAHYLKYLTDGDYAQNNMGWQWSAGCGVDAAPYFRVFNPVTQGQKFDPEGKYVRKYVPELAALPDRYLHAPWEAPPQVLSQAGLTLGVDYPEPMVDLKVSREEFLARAQTVLRKTVSG
jgi:deoxyribodipyrimidine photo-lyase